MSLLVQGGTSGSILPPLVHCGHMLQLTSVTLSSGRNRYAKGICLNSASSTLTQTAIHVEAHPRYRWATTIAPLRTYGPSSSSSHPPAMDACVSFASCISVTPRNSQNAAGSKQRVKFTVPWWPGEVFKMRYVLALQAEAIRIKNVESKREDKQFIGTIRPLC